MAFDFDGTDDYVLVPHNDSLDVSSGLTVDAWILIRTLPADLAPIVSKWDDITGPKRRYLLAVRPDGSVRFDVSAFGQFTTGVPPGSPSSAATLENAFVVSAVKVPLNTWTHVAGVFDRNGQKMQVFVNGVADTSVTTVFNPFGVVGTPLLIGAGDVGSAVRQFTDGKIDEVEIFNRPLTPGEILSIVTAGPAGKCKVTVTIDIKPCSFPNAINLRTGGVIPVAILGSAMFDASQIDPTTVALDGMEVKTTSHPLCSIEDVEGSADVQSNSCNADGFPDMVCHILTDNVTVTNGMMRLTGMTITGISFAGLDSVVLVPPPH